MNKLLKLIKAKFSDRYIVIDTKEVDLKRGESIIIGNTKVTFTRVKKYD